ncbi:GTP cyclohydrolase I FolE [Roseibium sp.]|uniref:GTP cyclohydrolase I FolE n=1 Tax=Roseibium sp. TaxID=1936156 RepID=UPI0025D995E6|nr:GTP cyclohydrolase I FolE [Roseibium sp.]
MTYAATVAAMAEYRREHGLRPSRADAEAAVRVLLEWSGDNPDREGLVDTPARVVRAYEEFFEGYKIDPAELLARTFEETNDYNDLIVLRNMRLESHCEHHVVPIIGKVHVAYLPANRVVGISKLARVVEVFAKRLQIQETLTSQVADTIQEVLQPRGVAVVVEAAHMCMTTRGIKKPGVSMMTRRLLGEFQTDAELRRDFLSSISGYKGENV